MKNKIILAVLLLMMVLSVVAQITARRTPLGARPPSQSQAPLSAQQHH